MNNDARDTLTDLMRQAHRPGWQPGDPPVDVDAALTDITRRAAAAVSWPARLAMDLRAADPCLSMSLRLAGGIGGLPTVLRIASLAPCEHDAATRTTARALNAVVRAADLRGVPVVVRPATAADTDPMRALYLSRGFTPGRFGNLVHQPAPPPCTWRLSGPGQPRALLLYRGTLPVTDPPGSRQGDRPGSRRFGHVVHLRRRRDAPGLLELLHRAQVLGVMHGACPNRAWLEVYSRGCPTGTPHTGYYLNSSGDLYAKRFDGRDRETCLITRDQQHRRTLADMAWALTTSYHIGCGDLPRLITRPTGTDLPE